MKKTRSKNGKERMLDKWFAKSIDWISRLFLDLDGLLYFSSTNQKHKRIFSEFRKTFRILKEMGFLFEYFEDPNQQKNNSTKKKNHWKSNWSIKIYLIWIFLVENEDDDGVHFLLVTPLHLACKNFWNNKIFGWN